MRGNSSIREVTLFYDVISGSYIIQTIPKWFSHVRRAQWIQAIILSEMTFSSAYGTSVFSTSTIVFFDSISIGSCYICFFSLFQFSYLNSLDNIAHLYNFRGVFFSFSISSVELDEKGVFALKNIFNFSSNKLIKTHPCFKWNTIA